MKAANKVVVNTGILYGRMLITVGISLYSTRLILNALGSVDYGIFNLVAGVIAMLAFLNNAMATSTQRFLSFYQGKKDIIMQRKVFGSSLLLHIIIGLIIVAALEIAGFFLFGKFLNIPASRLETAKDVYHLMSAAVFFTILAVPFNGSLVAHENMLWVAVVNIVEVILKLLIAIALYRIQADRLIAYSVMMAGVNVLSLLLYAGYCFRKYSECSMASLKSPDLKTCRELSSFTGWNLFGALCGLGRTQGIAVILNIFFGTVVNAAYGIANQVASQLNFFSSTMLRALNPQIMKSEGSGDRQRMLRLSMMASKFGFFLLSVVGIPCIFEMKEILTLWLKNVPQNTVIFCQLILVGTLSNQLTIGLQSAVQATGKIKFYQMVVGSIILLNLPIAYGLLAGGYPVYSVLVSYVFVELTACSVRLLFLRKLAGLSIRQYAKSVFLREALPVALMVAVCSLVTTWYHFELRFLLTFPLSILSFLLGLYLTGLEPEEKRMIAEMIGKVFGRLGKIKKESAYPSR